MRGFVENDSWESWVMGMDVGGMGGNKMPLECCYEPIFCFGLFETIFLLFKRTSINN